MIGFYFLRNFFFPSPARTTRHKPASNMKAGSETPGYAKALPAHNNRPIANRTNNDIIFFISGSFILWVTSNVCRVTSNEIRVISNECSKVYGILCRSEKQSRSRRRRLAAGERAMPRQGVEKLKSLKARSKVEVSKSLKTRSKVEVSKCLKV